MWIIAINGEEPIIAQGASDELNCHQTQRGKSKVKISLRRGNNYQRTDIEDICSILYQVIPVVSHLEVFIPKKLLTPNKIGEALRVAQIQVWKEALFVEYDKNKNFSLLSDPISINTSL